MMMMVEERELFAIQFEKTFICYYFVTSTLQTLLEYSEYDLPIRDN